MRGLLLFCSDSRRSQHLKTYAHLSINHRVRGTFVFKLKSKVAVGAVVAGLMLSLAAPAMAQAAPSTQATVRSMTDTPSNSQGQNDNTDKKVWVCKYVGTPGVNETLKEGKQPISVSVNTLKGFDGSFPWAFPDAQGRSIAIAYDTGQSIDASACPAPEGGPTIVKDAVASVSTVAATCDAPAKLVYGAIANATWSGTPDGTTGPASYAVTATGTSTDTVSHVFSDGSATQTFTGDLSGPIPPQSTDPSAPCYVSPPSSVTITTSHQTAVCTESGTVSGNVLTATNTSGMDVTLTLTEGSVQRQADLTAGQTTTFNDNWLQHEGMPYGTITLSAVASMPGTTITFDGGNTWTPVDPTTLSCGPTSTWHAPTITVTAVCVDPKTGHGDIKYEVAEPAANANGTTYSAAFDGNVFAVFLTASGKTTTGLVSDSHVTVTAGTHMLTFRNVDDQSSNAWSKTYTIKVEACAVTPPVVTPPVVTPPVVKPPVVTPPAHHPVGPSAHTGLDTAAANPLQMATEDGMIATAIAFSIFTAVFYLRRRKLAKVGADQ